MTDSLKIKEKVKERYGKVALTGDSCCGPSVSVEEEEDVAQEIIMLFYNLHNQLHRFPNW